MLFVQKRTTKVSTWTQLTKSFYDRIFLVYTSLKILVDSEWYQLCFLPCLAIYADKNISD